MAIDIEYRTYESFELPDDLHPIWTGSHVSSDFDAYSIYNFYLIYVVEKVLRIPFKNIAEDVVIQGPVIYIPGKYIVRVRRFIADGRVPIYRLRKGMIYTYEELKNIQLLEAIVINEIKYAAGLINDGTFGPYIK